MKNSAIAIILWCAGIISCTPQKLKISEAPSVSALSLETIKDSTRYFNISRFEKNKTSDGRYFYEKNDSIVTERKMLKGYEVKKSCSKKKNFYAIYNYDENGLLVQKSTYFNNIQIGKKILYDKNGNIIYIEEFDNNPSYGFNYNDIIIKLKEKSNIDLENLDNFYLLPISYHHPNIFLKSKYDWLFVKQYKIDDVSTTQKSFWLIDSNYEGEMVIKVLKANSEK